MVGCPLLSWKKNLKMCPELVDHYKALALGIKRRFMPSREGVEPLLCFSGGTGVFGVHVDAVGAAVDLRGVVSCQLRFGVRALRSECA